eukprot:3392735-Rhodomonas_salina.1
MKFCVCYANVQFAATGTRSNRRSSRGWTCTPTTMTPAALSGAPAPLVQIYPEIRRIYPKSDSASDKSIRY